MADRLTDAQIDKARRLIWPHLESALRVARHFTRDSHEADDLVQETVMKGLRFIDQLADGSDARSWLLTILRRTFIDRYRASRRFKDHLPLHAAPEPAGHDGHRAADDADAWHEPEQLMDRFEDEQIIGAMAKLPDEIRWTLLLVDVEQVDHAEAAAVLDVPVGTIKSRAHRGRAMLRNALADLARQRGWIAPVEQTP